MGSSAAYDVIVIGLGPGGEYVATELARAGLAVAAIDERLVGGECPYYGCVPTKMMVTAARELRAAGRASAWARSAEPLVPDWTPVADRIRDEATDDWNDQVAVDRLVDAGVTFIRGRGRLAGERRVVVSDGIQETHLEARRGVVLNTGTRPALPPIDGLAEAAVWTNREVVALRELPESLIVVGGGPIGAELAQVFATFGVEVTVLEGAPQLLGREEPDAAALVTAQFREDGITVHTGVTVRAVTRTAAGSVTATFSAQDGTAQQVSAAQILVAAGRRPNLDDLGLETVGLDPAARQITVDAWLRAGPGLWAVGDITGVGAFTHLSMYQAEVAVRDLLGQGGLAADYRSLSRATFTVPEVGAVGLTEAAAREQGYDVRIGVADLGSRGWLAQTKGTVKVVVDATTDRILGGTAVGPEGGEMVSFLVAAIEAEMTASAAARAHFAYPTFFRAWQTALREASAATSE